MASTPLERDLVTAILFFAATAKLWIDLFHPNHSATTSDDDDDDDDALLETTEERRTRRNLRLSIDSPSFSEHHFLPRESSSPFRKKSRWPTRKNRIASLFEEEDGTTTTTTAGDLANSVTFLNAECPRWRNLMERVSIADSVLTRDASMDFKTNNSNWSHFEGYESPIKQEDQVESLDEKFPWSDPPLTDNPSSSSTLAQQQHNNNNNIPQTIHRRSSSLEIIRKFNATIMPNKLIMIRHGQSEGNVDEILYSTKPDNAMRLTRLGWDTARMAGKALRDQLGQDETVHFVVSPYVRTVETFHGIVSAWVDPEEFGHIRGRNGRLKAWYTRLMEMGLSWHEDPRIREQDFGNYQDPETIRKCKSERHKFGSFYYRFPHGESASDVFDRVSTFLDSLWRSFETQKAQNYVLVTHGISIRVFLARYFRYSIDQFNMLANPKNCEMIILKHDGSGRLQLDSRCEMEFETVDNDDCGNDAEKHGGENKAAITRVVGYAKHRRLKLLSPHLIQPRMVHMFYNDASL